MLGNTSGWLVGAWCKYPAEVPSLQPAIENDSKTKRAQCVDEVFELIAADAGMLNATWFLTSNSWTTLVKFWLSTYSIIEQSILSRCLSSRVHYANYPHEWIH